MAKRNIQKEVDPTERSGSPLSSPGGSPDGSPHNVIDGRVVKPRFKKFVLIRTFSVSDFITLGNAGSGVCAIFLCLNYLENSRYQPYLTGVFFLLPLALLFDILDGSVARWRRKNSPYGLDLDSLADVVSFSVAPAVLGFTLGLRGIWDSAILCFFVCCGISRLARYNVSADELSAGTGKVKYYQGFPVPTSLLLVLMFGIAFWQGAVFENLWFGKLILPGGGTFHPLSFIYVILGSGMMSSRLHIPKLN